MKTMHHPNPFDDFIQRVYEATGIRSQSELAAALNVNRSAITQAKNKGHIPEKWYVLLSRAYGLHPAWLESGKGPAFLNVKEPDDTGFQKVPKVRARLSAGGGSFEVGAEIEGYYAFRSDWLHGKGTPADMILMDIFGNSMAPELKDGDTVLIDQSLKNIISGAIFAVGVDDTIMVKRLEKHPNKLVLHSDNSHYEPIYLRGGDLNGVRIIGKIIWVGREYN